MNASMIRNLGPEELIANAGKWDTATNILIYKQLVTNVKNGTWVLDLA